MAPPRLRRWPIEPLLEAAGTTSFGVLADRIAIDRREVYRWRAAGGVTRQVGERAAVRLGRHPLELWPDWLDADIAAVDEIERSRIERRRERDRRDAALYRQRHPDRVARQQAEYHARPENREAKRRYRQAYYRLNRDEVLARQRERDRARRRSDAA